jgi:hypothetical protein
VRIAKPVSVIVWPGCDCGCAIVDRAITVVVDRVAQLRRAGMNGGLSVITILSADIVARGAIGAVHIHEPITVRVLVAHGPRIAVLVVAIRIAYFRRAWKAGRITVIAVIA